MTKNKIIKYSFLIIVILCCCRKKEKKLFPFEEHVVQKIEKKVGCRECSNDSIFRGRCFMEIGDHIIHYAKYYKDKKYDTEVFYNLKNYKPKTIKFYTVHFEHIFSMEIENDTMKIQGQPYYFTLEKNESDSTKIDFMVYSMVVRGYAAKTILKLSNNQVTETDTNIIFTDCRPYLYKIPFDTMLTIDFTYIHYFSLEQKIEYHEFSTYKLNIENGLLKWDLIYRKIKKKIVN